MPVVQVALLGYPRCIALVCERALRVKGGNHPAGDWHRRLIRADMAAFGVCSIIALLIGTAVSVPSCAAAITGCQPRIDWERTSLLSRRMDAVVLAKLANAHFL